MKRNKFLLFIQRHVWKQQVNLLLHDMPPDVAFAHGVQNKVSHTAVKLLICWPVIHFFCRSSLKVCGLWCVCSSLCSATPPITAVPSLVPLLSSHYCWQIAFTSEQSLSFTVGSCKAHLHWAAPWLRSVNDNQRQQDFQLQSRGGEFFLARKDNVPWINYIIFLWHLRHLLLNVFLK